MLNAELLRKWDSIMNTSCILGIDAGGTHTDAALLAVGGENAPRLLAVASRRGKLSRPESRCPKVTGMPPVRATVAAIASS